MKLKLLVLFALFTLFLECSKPKKEGSDDEKQIVRRHIDPFTTTIDSQTIALENDNFIFTGTGAIMNGSNRELTEYKVFVLFRIINGSGKDYLLWDDPKRVITKIDNEKKPWKSKTEKAFTIKYTITRKDLEFNAANVYISYNIKGVDSEGEDFNEIAGEGEITYLWREAQAKMNTK